VTGSLTTAHLGATATLLSSGRVLVAAGFNRINLSGHNMAEVYDPKTGEWTTTSRLAVSRFSHSATLLPTGQVLIAGGLHGGPEFTNVELYSEETATWTATASLATARLNHTATLLQEGNVLVVGGYSPSTGPLASTEMYHPGTQP
jgi:hypothetical protein